MRRSEGRQVRQATTARQRLAAALLLLLLPVAACGRSLYSPPACSDGVDNDGDGRTDLLDPQCADPGDDDEGGAGGADADGDADVRPDTEADEGPDGEVDVGPEGDVEPEGDADVGPEGDADVEPEGDVAADGDAEDDAGGDDGDVHVPCDEGLPCSSMPLGRCVSGACASVWEGEADGDKFGAAVALEGALAATAPTLAPGHVLVGASEAVGRAGRVVLGAAATWVELQTWDGTTTLERLGSALALGPELDGSGGPSVAFGVRPDGSLSSTGRVEIRSTTGPAFALIRELAGPAVGSLFGASLAWGPDVDADGMEELVVGAPSHRPGSVTTGTATLFAGGDWTELRSWSGAGGGDQFGAAVARGPALSAGRAAVTLIGAPGVDSGPTDAGCAYLYEGTSGTPLWSECGDGLYAAFGAAVAAGVDANGDGHGNYAVAAPGRNDGQGRVQLYASVELWSWDGEATYDDFGWAIALGPDADGVTGGELLVGAPGVDGDRGRVYLFRHDSDVPVRTWDGEEAGDRFGCAVSLGGDVDGDGLADVLVGACGSVSSPGRAYLFGSASW
jgi:hypothetical protein